MHCQSYPGFIFTEQATAYEGCFCCNDLNEVSPVVTEWSLYIPGGSADVTGDPHITTLDGKHYTLLKQGTFSLWHFAGLKTDFHSKEAGTKTVPVEWHVYAHYSGRQSFTKGLLLLDNSGGSTRQVLEITSQNCEWRARKGNEPWQPIQKAELITVPNGKDYVTGFNVSDCSQWSQFSKPSPVQHEHQKWQKGHCHHEPELQTRSQYQPQDGHDKQHGPSVC